MLHMQSVNRINPRSYKKNKSFEKISGFPCTLWVPIDEFLVCNSQRCAKLSPKSLKGLTVSSSKSHCLLIALLILTGCASSTPPSRPPIPANLASPCPAIDSFTSPSWDELMKSYLKLVIQYSECSDKHAAVSGANK